MSETRHLLVFGPGYSAEPLMARAKAAGFQVSATYRRPEAADWLTAEGYGAIPFDSPDQAIQLEGVTHVLTSIAPRPDDPVLAQWGAALQAAAGIGWIGYLSSTNVYGDHQGADVDENTPPNPGLERGKRRLTAEQAWQHPGEQPDARVLIFRLAGIYGPGRNAIRNLKTGRARRINKPGQVFGRIHRDDICQALWLSMESDKPAGIYNLADDEPLPPDETVRLAAEALAVDPPPLEDWESAQMSEMARSFYLESKRVRNHKVKQQLGLAFRYPSIRDAFPDLIKSET